MNIQIYMMINTVALSVADSVFLSSNFSRAVTLCKF